VAAHDAGAGHSNHRAAASVLNRLPVPDRVRRIGNWLRRRITPEWTVGIAASALSVGFYAWYARQGLLFAQGDAISHLMIARRVFDSRTPGLAQLGSVWPPLNHILMLPLIWNDTLWRDGFAGAFPSMVAYVVSVVYMFRLGKWCFGSGTAGFVAALAFMVNPSVLYMQSTAMSELDLLCAAILGIYYLLQWASAFHAHDLVKAAGAIAAGTLVRYDGWALAGGAVLIVAYVAWRRQGRVAGEAQTILFSTLALAGCVAWLIYNWVIFSDPLYSFTGPYSARNQEQRIAATSGLPTQHNVWLSLQEYGQAVIGTVGWPIAIVALLGLIGFVWRLRFRPGILPAYGTLVPFAFNWASLFLGISILLAPEIKIHGVGSYFNVRYGMMMIPAVALFLASWSTWRREVLVGILGLIVVFSGLNPALGTPYALRGPLHDAGRIADMDEGKWLALHYQGGTVLMSEGPFSPMTFYSNLPDRAFLTEANGAEFRTAVAHPETSVTWIVMDSDSVNYDAVWAGLGNRQDWHQYFVLVQVTGTTQIYQRIGSN
jgi:Dolichyl-phosphate-mannose-protein mannosyltransferase